MSNALAEYLIKIGYSINTSQQKKAEKSLSATEKKLKNLGLTAVGTATAIAVMSDKFAYDLRKAYFSADVANTSIKGMASMKFAAKQIGISGEEMEASLKGIAMAIRANPGTQALIEGITGVSQAGKETDKTMLDLSDSFVKMTKEQGGSEMLAIQWGQQLGLNAEMVHKLITGHDELAASVAKSDARIKQSGVDTDVAADAALKYTGAMDAIKDRFGLLGKAIAISFLPSMLDSAKSIESHINFWTQWARGTQTVSEALDGITAHKFWSFIRDESPKTMALFSKIGDFFTGGSPKTMDALSGAGEKVAQLKDELIQKSPKTMGALQSAKEGIGNASDKVMSFFMGKGWSKEQAAGITANLKTESNFDPRAVGDSGKAKGLAQWHPDRQKGFEKKFGHSIDESTTEEQLEFMNYELTEGTERRAGNKLKATTTAAEAGAAVSKYYERPAATDKEMLNRGNLATQLADNTRLGTEPKQAAQINQTTNINVTGTGAEATGKAVANAQSRVNGDMVRNMNGAVR